MRAHSHTHTHPSKDAIRLNAQSAMRNMQNSFRRSELGLGGPKNGLEIGPRKLPGVHSAKLSAQIPNLLTSEGLEG
eukprot:5358495-Alexandrium_andersonii.AAC.1